MKTKARRLIEKPPLSYSEEQALRKERETLRDVEDEVEIKQGLKHEVSDPRAIKERIRNIDKQLENSAEQATGSKRVALERREKALRVYLQKRNPSWKEYTRMRPKDGVQYSEMVDLIRKNNEDPKYQRLVNEWKGIRRQLDIENPRASDTRYLMRQ